MLLTFIFFCLFLFSPVLSSQQCRLFLGAGSSPPPATHSASPTTPTPTANGDTHVDPTGSPTASATPSPTPFQYGIDPIRGVNLGGWFVLEPWITPSLFENTNDTSIVDEFTLSQKLDPDTVQGILQNHWQTWITEDDFKAIKAAGLNHVRMQIGYWSIPITSADTKFSTSPAPYATGAWPYLLQALNWAKANDLNVIIDLHGAPGSQNGFDNSGQRTGNPTWGSDPNNIPRTVDIIRFIAANIGGMIDVLEILNEPAAFRPEIGGALAQFWQDGYHAVRNATSNLIPVMIGDGFLGVESWENFMTYPAYQNVIMDYHEYQIFNFDQIELSFPEHIDYSCQLKNNLTTYQNSNMWTIIGEWTTSPTDCALWINGRGVGARWDGTWQPNLPTFGSCENMTDATKFSDDYKAFLRQYYESQIAIGESIKGWVYWTWKTEPGTADDWSYQKGLEGGWIPQDPTDRMYPDICSGSD